MNESVLWQWAPHGRDPPASGTGADPVVLLAEPACAAEWSMTCAVQWQLPQRRGHALGVPLGRVGGVHSRNYCWVWFSSVLDRDCEVGVVS